MAQNIKILFNINGKATSESLKKVRDGLKGIGAQAGALQKANANAKQLQNTTKGLGASLKTAAGNVAGFIGAYAGFSAILQTTGAIIEFNRAVAEVQTIAKVTGPRLNDIKKGLLEVSDATGKSATDAARTFYQIQSAGITDVAQAQKVLNASLKLSVGSLAEAETTTLALTKSIAIYGDEIQDVTEFSNTLFRGVELGQTNMQDLASSIPAVLGPAKTLGISFKDLVGQIASFSKRAGSTSQAVTQLNSIFTAVAKNQERARQVLGDNAKAFSVQALRAKGLTKFMKDLNVATGGNIEVLTKLFGRKEAASGFLAAAADGFQDLDETVRKNNITLGASDRAFQEIANSIGGQADILRERVKNIFISFSVSGENIVVSTLKGINGAIESFKNNISDISRITTKFFVAVLTIKAITAFRTLKTQFISFKAQSFSAFATANTSVLAFIRSITVAKISVAGLSRTIKVAKASLTFGLTLAIDFLIEKFLELKEQVGGFGNLWSVFKIKGEIALKAVKIIMLSLGNQFAETAAKVKNGIRAITGRPPDNGLEKSINARKMQIIELQKEMGVLNKQKNDLFKKPESDGLEAALNKSKTTSPTATTGTTPAAPPNIELDPIVQQTTAALKEKERLELEFLMLKEQREMLQKDKDFSFLQEKLGTEEALRRTAAKKSAVELEKNQKKKALIIANADKAVAQQRTKITKADLKFSDLSNKEKLQQTSNTLGLTLALTKAAGKKFFAITKAVSLADAIVSGTLAVQKALASAPPPLSFINAGLIGATTALNVAKIASSKPPAYRTGGLVQGGAGTSGTGDSVTASLAQREMVLTRPQQSALYSKIQSGELGGESGTVIEAIVSLKNAIMNQAIVVEADGREIALLVRDQVRSGVQIA